MNITVAVGSDGSNLVRSEAIQARWDQTLSTTSRSMIGFSLLPTFYIAPSETLDVLLLSHRTETWIPKVWRINFSNQQTSVDQSDQLKSDLSTYFIGRRIQIEQKLKRNVVMKFCNYYFLPNRIWMNVLQFWFQYIYFLILQAKHGCSKTSGLTFQWRALFYTNTVSPWQNIISMWFDFSLERV